VRGRGRGGHRIAACRETYSEHVYTPGRVSNEAADTALLIRRAQAGDDHAVEVLIDRARPVIRAVLVTRYLVGQTQADMWSLATEYTLVALRDYRPGRASWRTFLSMVLCRRLDADITASRRKKRWRGQRDLPLDEIGEREIPDPNAPDPARMADVIDADTLALWLGSRLSGLEEAVARGIAEGLSYADIAQQLGVRQKTVDNALQRLRRKALRDRDTMCEAEQ